MAIDIDSLPAPPGSTATTPQTGSVVDSLPAPPPQSYGSKVSAAANNVWESLTSEDSPGQGSPVHGLLGAGETLATGVRGALAPVVAGGRAVIDTLGSDVGFTPAPTANTFVGYKNQFNSIPIPQNDVANNIQALAGTALEPVGNLLHSITSIVSNDPDKQQVASDLASTLAGVATGKLLTGKAAATELPLSPEHVEKIQSLNDITQARNLPPLTKAQLKSSLGGDAAASRVLESDLSVLPGGKKVGDIYKAQQQAIIDKLHEFADEGDQLTKESWDRGEKIDGLINTKNPNGPILNYDKFDKFTKDLDVWNSLTPEGVSALSDLAEYVDHTRPLYSTGSTPPKFQVSPIAKGIVSSVTGVLGGLAGGHVGGAVEGGLAGAYFGKELFGEIAPKLVQSTVNRVKSAGLLDTSAPNAEFPKGELGMGDVKTYAKQNRMTSEEAAIRLIRNGYKIQ